MTNPVKRFILNPIKRFFLFSSGATTAILDMKGCEAERNKYAGIGVTIFFTAALASLSGGYALFTVFQNERLSMAFGLLWGLIIFNLDRFIVSSIRKQKVPANASFAQRAALKAGEFIKALPRLVLAIFISVVITRPIELKLFDPEIQEQVTKSLTQGRAEAEEAIRTEYADIEEDEGELKELRDRKVELTNEVTRRVALATGELEGWRGTTNPGDGPEYKRRLAEAGQAKEELAAFKNQYDKVIEAKATQIELRKQERDLRVAESKGVVDKSKGLLKRLEAFSALTSSHTSVLLASVFLLLLFISLETAPILVKLFSNRGPYDDYLDSSEHRVYATQQKEMSDLNDDINTSVALSRQLNADRLQAELQLSQNTMGSLQSLAPQELHDAQTEIARRVIALWQAAELNRLGHTPAPALWPQAAPPGQGAAPASNNGGGSHPGAAAPTRPTPTQSTTTQPMTAQAAGQSAPHIAPPAGPQPPAAGAPAASSPAQPTAPGAAPPGGAGAAQPPPNSMVNNAAP